MKSGGHFSTLASVVVGAASVRGLVVASLSASLSLSRGSAEQIGRADSKCRIGRRRHSGVPSVRCGQLSVSNVYAAAAVRSFNQPPVEARYLVRSVPS